MSQFLGHSKEVCDLLRQAWSKDQTYKEWKEENADVKVTEQQFHYAMGFLDMENWK